MRIALFGGSFDPPHRGHTAVAAAAADEFALQTIFFAPAGRQPLKPGGSSASFADRLAMTRLACQADSRFAVSELDAPRPDGRPNYTVDTLDRLRNEFPDATLFAIIGADSLQQLPRWHDSERLLGMAEWIVVSRPGVALAEDAGMEETADGRRSLHLLRTVHEDVSATELRERLAEGSLPPGMIAPAVAEYIRSHGLYGRRSLGPAAGP